MSHPEPGVLIAFEGADASGKSTQARRLAQRLSVTATFQFGATEIGAGIRRILLDPVNTELDDRCEALLIIADKAQHVTEIVRPALERDELLISDRFTASTLAYQGHGRGLNLTTLTDMMVFATGGLQPDLTILLDVSLELARERLGDEADRIEAAGPDFHQRVRDGYLQMAQGAPDRWRVIDASGTVDDVSERVNAAVDGWLSEHHPARLP
jgi:dTMP kinase